MEELTSCDVGYWRSELSQTILEYIFRGFRLVDSTDRERLWLARKELYKLLAAEELKKSKMLIFANKQDVVGCMSVAEISQNLNLTSIRDHPWHIQACCALTGEGLPQGLDWFVSQVGR
ncbi:hypothetical protein EG68_06617 [Paragonimus skrjabini miyazakii]|uniref:ADP-ribosylation factor-like protein 5B n=1 Tax=Paragonimus skrjabini miyazakii TaxID=59628 RepID=A0A8S9YU24_9TREM|nr:hypothetical protein EG68_06617 [Paragonimus skrjabini miyazakii]